MSYYKRDKCAYCLTYLDEIYTGAAGRFRKHDPVCPRCGEDSGCSKPKLIGEVGQWVKDTSRSPLRRWFDGKRGHYGNVWEVKS